MSNIYTPRRPSGDDEEARFHQAVWDVLFGGQFPFVNTEQAAWSHGPQGYWPTLKVPPPSRKVGPFPFEIYRKADDTPDADDPYKFRVRAAKVHVVVSGDTGYLKDFAGNEAGPSLVAPSGEAEVFVWFDVDPTTHDLTLDSSEIEPEWNTTRYLIGVLDASGDRVKVAHQHLNWHQTIFLCS